jgi:hydroxyethylthiazole kinase-like uncharacterized protein yjeF
MSQPVLLDRQLLQRFPLPLIPEDADKKQRGLALFIAGSRELAGAAILAGLGALRVGAGRLRIATAASVAQGIAVAVPEARVLAFAEGEDGCIDPVAIDGLVERCRSMDSLTIGPGMQPGDALATLVQAVLDAGGHFSMVIDAAALGELPPLAAKLRGWNGDVVLLPHLGEMARMLQCEARDVADDPKAAACEAAKIYGAAVVLKGAPSFIACPEGQMFRYPGGGVGLATSGSGDVLAGLVGGLAARRADPLTAALWGVWLHGEAGRRLTQEVGRVGFLAREILDYVPKLMEH